MIKLAGKIFTLIAALTFTFNANAFLSCDEKEEAINTTIFYYTESYQKVCKTNFNIQYFNRIKLERHIASLIEGKGQGKWNQRCKQAIKISNDVHDGCYKSEYADRFKEANCLKNFINKNLEHITQEKCNMFKIGN